MKKILLLAIPIFFCLSCSRSTQGVQSFATEQGILFSENGDNVLYYQRAPKSVEGLYTRNNYVHPLWTLDGDTLTEDAPPDHLHHRGIFWTWHQIFVGNIKLGDAWVCENFVWDVVDAAVEDAGAGAKTLAVTVLYKSPDFVDQSGEMIAAVKENTRITVYPKKENYRAIDFDISLLALQDDVKIGGSDNVKGYGGFSPCIKCPDDLTFISSTGALQPENTAIEAGPWMNFLGSFNGKTQSGFAVLCHPANPQPINTWILRQKASMQNPVYPGRELTLISQTEPTLLHYRVIVHNGHADVAALYKEYEKNQ